MEKISQGKTHHSLVSQKTLLRLARSYPKPNLAKQEYRQATCANCERPMVRMYHCWLTQGGFYKELHLCKTCYETLRYHPHK